MKIPGIEHISINVVDLESSARFYQGTLGFERLETVPEQGFTITYFALPGGRRLELLRLRRRQPPAAPKRDRRRPAPPCLRGGRRRRGGARAPRPGVPIVLPTTELPELGVRVLLFQDPDGVTLEFCERLNHA